MIHTVKKATAQIVLPLDTAIDINSSAAPTKNAPSFLKITENKLYRINGTTAQFSGVHPDIILPDALQVYGERESGSINALNLPQIYANKYYRPYTPIQKDALQSEAVKDIASGNYFKELKSFTDDYKKEQEPKDISLKFADALKEHAITVTQPPAFTDSSSVAVFKVENDLYEQQRMTADNDLKESNEYIRDFLQRDPYLEIAYKILLLMK